MDQLEDAICKATRDAYKRYKNITGGYWLWHAPEHFLQNFVLLRLGQGYTVHAEATRKKIEAVVGKRNRGPKPKAKVRYDLVVWQRVRPSLRAVVEVKRCYVTTCGKGLKLDAKRIKHARTGENGAKHGYLLVYSEKMLKKGRSGLLEVFKGWAKGLGLGLVKHEILDKNGTDDKGKPWESGYCLLKTDWRSAHG